MRANEDTALMKFVWSAAALIGVCIVDGVVAVAQEKGLSNGVRKQITVESVYNYVMRNYIPPFALVPVTRQTASAATAEAAVIGNLSAMVNGDWDWFISAWDE